MAVQITTFRNERAIRGELLCSAPATALAVWASIVANPGAIRKPRRPLGVSRFAFRVAKTFDAETHRCREDPGASKLENVPLSHGTRNECSGESRIANRQFPFFQKPHPCT